MYRFIIATLALSLLVMGCTAERDSVPLVPDSSEHVETAIDPEAMGRSIVHLTGWTLIESEVIPEDEHPAPHRPGSWIDFLGREEVGGVAHYEWRLRVGPGTYDVIGLHRVVRERRPWRPIRTADNVFMVHGDLKNFEGCFLPGLLSPTTPDDFGIAVYLAQEDLDVWGLDHASTLVPGDEMNLDFMSEWDLAKHARDIDTGMLVARVVRRLTGSSFGKMNLLGYSGGSAQGFTVLNDETQRPGFLRNVSGFIPVDTGMLNDIPEYAESNCGTVAYYEELLAAGEYGEYSLFLLFGEPARDDPDGESELWPGLTNLEAALALVSLPFDPVFPIHYWAGTLDEAGTPLGLQYTDVALLIDFMTNGAPPWLPTLYSKEIYLAHCTGGEPWTENFGEIENPIFWVSAQGGFGPWETYTLDALGSSDVTLLNVQLHPDDEQDLDYGHVDPFTADNAPMLVWQPVLDWLQTH